MTLDKRWERLYVAAGAMAMVVVLGSDIAFPAYYGKAQTSRAPELVRLLCDQGDRLKCPRAARIIDATRRDDAFVLAYLVLGLVAVWCLAGLRTWASDVPRRTGGPGWLPVGLLYAGGVADIFENELLHESAARLHGQFFLGPDAAVAFLGGLPDLTVITATVKWSLLAGGFLVVAWNVFGPPRARARVGEGPAYTADGAWAAPPDDEERVGICCSGGGIRSAAFSLGALQSLRAYPEGRPLLHRAKYLSAVSGGGYLAAGLAVAENTVVDKVPPVFDPGSEEERHFRDNSSYLVPSLAKGAVGVARLLAGLVLNLALVWLVLFAIARPVGWVIGEVHPELRARSPVALTRDPYPALGVAGVQAAGTQGDALLFEVDLGDIGPPPVGTATKDEETPTIHLDVAPFTPSDAAAECSYRVADERTEATAQGRDRTRVEDDRARARHALVAVSGGKAEVVRQPIVEPLVPAGPAGRCTALAETLEVERQPELAFRSDAVGASPDAIRAELWVSTQPRVTSATGLRGRDDLSIEVRMWLVLAATTGAALLFGFLLVMLRPSGSFALRRSRDWARDIWTEPQSLTRRLLHRLGEKRTWLLWPSVAAALAALALFLLLAALPWLVQELPPALGKASGAFENAVGSAGGGLQDYLLPSGGALFLAVTALRRYLAGAPDTDDGRTKVDSPGVLKRAWRWLTGRSKELSWYELSPLKVLLGVLLVVSAVIVFVLQLQYSSANGPGGRLMGMAFLRDKLSDGWWLPEWKRYAAVLLGLLVLQRVVDAHAWSLQPFYKRRLSCAYLEGRRGGVGYDDGPLPFHDLKPQPGFPQLVVGCAVNLSEVGLVPPGRRASSFTMSSTEIGGPLVGYVRMEDYWQRMRRARQKDITVPGAMAISGAAFSPAMGKMNLGPVGSIMALANLRLGVWLPHPQYVGDEATTPGSWIHRPGWSWFLREVRNRYRFDEPYLYVSDGGHWENLGLVELLRRGCTKIICINAGGDSQLSFGTIGEAVALAREELQVEFYDFDATPLRPPLKAGEGGRLLRRAIARDKPEALASVSYVCGRFRYPATNRNREGRIWLIEPALTADLPFDVHVFAESEAIFPDDSTADQVFNHRQFEAFRALGYHQASKVASDPVFLEPAED